MLYKLLIEDIIALHSTGLTGLYITKEIRERDNRIHSLPIGYPGTEFALQSMQLSDITDETVFAF